LAALGLSQPVEVSLLEWNVERLYRAIDDRGEPRPGSGGASQRQSPGAPRSRETGPKTGAARALGAGEASAATRAARPDGRRAAAVRSMGAHLHPDLVPDLAAQAAPQDQAEQTQRWSERLTRGHAGDGVHSMLRTLIADVPTMRVPWEQWLRVQLARGLSPRLDTSWSRPTRSYLANQGRCGPNGRLPWEPGLTQCRRVPRLAVMVDVSGSIDAALMTRFAGEIEAISRRLEAAVVVVIGDDQVRRVEWFDPERARPVARRLASIEFQGGGGTDFTPLLQEADRHRPDLAVFLTDLDGPAYFRPRWPVIWAVPQSQADRAAPFGRKLVLI